MTNIAIIAAVPVAVVLLAAAVVLLYRRCSRGNAEPQLQLKGRAGKIPAPLPRSQQSLPHMRNLTACAGLDKRSSATLPAQGASLLYLDMTINPAFDHTIAPPVFSGDLSKVGATHLREKWASNLSLKTSFCALPGAAPVNTEQVTEPSIKESVTDDNVDGNDVDDNGFQPPTTLAAVELSRAGADSLLREWGMTQGAYLFRTSKAGTVLSLVCDGKIGHYNVLADTVVRVAELERFVK